MDRRELWQISEKEISELGISIKYKGYYYLVQAVVISVETGLRKVSIYKELYDRIAITNNVTVESVEKCIRYSLDKAWTECRAEYFMRYYVTGKKPTNADVIAFISNRIRLERGPGF